MSDLATYSLTAGACHDSYLTAARALELAYTAIVVDHETATVTGPDGDCTIVGDADDCTVRLVSPSGAILAIQDVDAEEDLDCFMGA